MQVAITFGEYCPLHQGHLDIIMRAKKENDRCYVVVCGYDQDPRATEINLPLQKRYELIQQLFAEDEQVCVLKVDDTELGIDESMSPSNWRIWSGAIERQIKEAIPGVDFSCTWYVAEGTYQHDLENLIANGGTIASIINRNVILMKRDNPISGSKIRQNPSKYWQKIAYTFRPHFCKNILITGTASEGKSTLTRDIATYFGIPYCEEYARTYMLEHHKKDEDLTVEDFKAFLIGQQKSITDAMHRTCNGFVISDTDNITSLMYALSYIEDPNINLSEQDYEQLEILANRLSQEVKWKKIFLLPPKNNYVDDGLRYMKQANMDERQKNYVILTNLMEKYGLMDSAEILSGSFLENFYRVKEYIQISLTE